jgi:hypothetical protein
LKNGKFRLTKVWNKKNCQMQNCSIIYKITFLKIDDFHLLMENIYLKLGFKIAFANAILHKGLSAATKKNKICLL